MNLQHAIEIYAPRWNDRRVLIATYRVSDGTNLIKLTRAGAYNGYYTIPGSEIFKCPVTHNGSIHCYAVPMAMLKRVADQ